MVRIGTARDSGLKRSLLLDPWGLRPRLYAVARFAGLNRSPAVAGLNGSPAVAGLNPAYLVECNCRSQLYCRAIMTAPTELDPKLRDTAFFGHPKGLGPLFFTELWERFSYYGMRAILVLYMTSPLAEGGLGFDVKRAASIYGSYTMSVYLTALPGGLAADYLLGARLAVFLGGLIIAAGHFSMVFHSMNSFYLGMVLIAAGTGLLKPNISAMVGGLYGENDPRRDSGFSLFYMGINIGAVLAPLVCGYLG